MQTQQEEELLKELIAACKHAPRPAQFAALQFLQLQEKQPRKKTKKLLTHLTLVAK